MHFCGRLSLCYTCNYSYGISLTTLTLSVIVSVVVILKSNTVMSNSITVSYRCRPKYNCS